MLIIEHLTKWGAFLLLTIMDCEHKRNKGIRASSGAVRFAEWCEKFNKECIPGYRPCEKDKRSAKRRPF